MLPETVTLDTVIVIALSIQGAILGISFVALARVVRLWRLVRFEVNHAIKASQAAFVESVAPLRGRRAQRRSRGG